MAKKLALTPELLKEQSVKMASMKTDYESMSSSTYNVMKGINRLWGESLAKNIEAQINAAQRSMNTIVDMLDTGVKFSEKAATDFALADKELKLAMEQIGNSNSANGSWQEDGGAAGSGTSNSSSGDNTNTTTVNNGNTGGPISQSQGSSKANAEAANIHYYTQTSNSSQFEKEAWIGPDGVDYSNKASKSCGICSDAMMLSSMGEDTTPGDLLYRNGGNADWNTQAFKDYCSEKGIKYTEQHLTDTGAANMEAQLDAALAKWQENPDKYSAPSIRIKNTSNSHNVVVVGKNADGSYILADPGADNRTFRISDGKNGRSGSEYNTQLYFLMQLERT